jgi:hypothetical protein
VLTGAILEEIGNALSLLKGQVNEVYSMVLLLPFLDSIGSHAQV